MKELTTHNFEGMSLRSIEKDGEPWFIAKDVCGELDIKDASMAVLRLDEDEHGTISIGTMDSDEKGVVSTDTLGGPQIMKIINESGLYSLIMTSRKPEAKKFKKWVTSEVLPEIRKTGSYQQKPLSPAEQMLATAQFMIEQEKINAQIPVLQNDIAEIKNQIDQNDHIFHRGGYTSIKAYCKANKLNIDGRIYAAIGIACTEVCATQGLRVRKLPCPYFGEVNSYPVWVIDEVLLPTEHLD